MGGQAIETPATAREPFVMPAGLAMRYDPSAPEISSYITGYSVYSIFGDRAKGQTDWFLPGAANIRIGFDMGPMTVTIRNASFGPLPQAVLFGPTSHAMRTRTHGGTMVGIGISALGWSRLFEGSAGSVANHVVPLETLFGAQRTATLVALLASSDLDHQVKPRLDRFMEDTLGLAAKPEGEHEAALRTLMRLIVDDGTDDLKTLIGALGLDGDRLRRLAAYHLGFPPKLLLSRTRFLRSLMTIMHAGGAPNYAHLSSRYFDASHFIRDAHTYLGMTAHQFIALDKPLLTASLRLRPQVLGSVTQALHDISPTHPGSGA